jgi:hypothetical protein
METIIDTTILDYEKSIFMLHLIEYAKGVSYVSVEQVIHNEQDSKNIQRIKINAKALEDIILVLENYRVKLSNTEKTQKAKSKFSNSQKDELIKRYLKGIGIKDLAMQFDYSEKVIEKLLFENHIVMADNKVPKRKFFKTKFKKNNK